MSLHCHLHRLLLFSSLLPPFLHRHRSNMMRCNQWTKKQKTFDSSSCHCCHNPTTFHSHSPISSIWPFHPKPCLSNIYCPLSLTSPPPPPHVSSHYTRSVPVCVSRLSVTPCLQLLAQSEILQQEAAATAFALSLAHSLSLTHPPSSYCCWTRSSCADQFLLFSRSTHRHTSKQAHTRHSELIGHEGGCTVAMQLSCNIHYNINAAHNNNTQHQHSSTDVTCNRKLRTNSHQAQMTHKSGTQGQTEQAENADLTQIVTILWLRLECKQQHKAHECPSQRQQLTYSAIYSVSLILQTFQ